MNKHNATFHSYRESGKWYATGRGYLSADMLKVHDTSKRRYQILMDNDMKFPGLSGAGHEFMFVVIPDDDCEYGVPLLLRPL